MSATNRHLQDAVWKEAFEMYERDCGGVLWKAPKWVQEEYKNRARTGMGVTTFKEPLPAAIEEKQKQVNYWGDRCDKAEAALRELYAWHGTSSLMPQALRTKVLDILNER